jgi:AraC-like DNA-binding protein
MDFHNFTPVANITIDDVLKAHMADLSIQEQYGVKYHQFWINQKAGTVFCLTEGPDAKTCELVHQMAHGNIACAITEVEPGNFKIIMGEKLQIDHGLVKTEDGRIDIGYRNILVASVRAITEAGSSKELQLLQIPHWAKVIVSDKILEFHGRELRWDADGSIIGVFNEATDAVTCAQQIQNKLMNSSGGANVIFKIGISADQPVTKDGEFFTKSIKLAHRLCTTAEDNQILASSLVRKLCKEAVPGTSRFKYLEAAEEDFVSSLLEIAHRNLANKNFTIESMCKDIGVSRPQLYRKVTSLTGRAPNDFLRDIRMEKALNLLMQKTGNISQVALEVGYNNPSYFSKCFADKFGCMPSEVLARQYA